ncbi:MAG: hypothetical protein FJW79_05020 [Actinobacteria bacterium]|nr:hypothetical protein [Actinomycetota bacterium]
MRRRWLRITIWATVGVVLLGALALLTLGVLDLRGRLADTEARLEIVSVNLGAAQVWAEEGTRDASQRIDALASQMGTLESGVGDLVDFARTLSQQVTSALYEQGSFRNDLAGLTWHLDSLESSVGDLESSVGDLAHCLYLSMSGSYYTYWYTGSAWGLRQISRCE